MNTLKVFKREKQEKLIRFPTIDCGYLKIRMDFELNKIEIVPGSHISKT